MNVETYYEDIERLALAALLGAIIGLERELQGKEAGLRTIMMVSLGAALYTVVSYRMSYVLTGKYEDYTRIASYIVSGIGFIGGGLIFKSKSGVQGLTTATTVWAVTAIGMAAGSGLYIVAIASTVLCIIILLFLNFFEFYLEKIKLVRTYEVKMENAFSEKELLNEYFSEKKMNVLDTKAMREKEWNVYHITVRGPKRLHQTTVRNLLENKGVIELKY